MKKLIISIMIILGFFVFSACKKEDVSFKVLVPSGSPSLAQVKMHKELPILADNISYSIDSVSGAQAIPAAFASEEYEIIYAPVNIGAKMYNNNQKYVYVANVTWGNLFFATTKIGDFNIASLNNQVVNMFGAGTINDVIIKHILKEKGINISTDSTYESGTDITKNKLVTVNDSIVLIAEPVLSAAKMALLARDVVTKTISVQDLWKEVTGDDSYPQAGIFVKKEFLDKNEKVIKKYLKEVEGSCEYVNSNPSDAAQMATDLEYGLPAVSVLKEAIPNCNIKFKTAKDTKESLEKVFNLDLSQIGGKLPDKDFYAL